MITSAPVFLIQGLHIWLFIENNAVASSRAVVYNLPANRSYCTMTDPGNQVQTHSLAPCLAIHGLRRNRRLLLSPGGAEE